MSGRRTVLFVHGSGERAGLERVLHRLVDATDADRVRAVVAALAEGPYIDELEAAGIEVRRLQAVPRLRHVTAVPGAVRSIRDTIRATGAEIVQGSGEKMSVLAALAARPLGVPVVAWLHDAPARATDPAGRATQLAVRATRPTSVVCCADWLADAFRRRYRLPATCIRNGLDLDGLPDATAGRAALLAETGWPDDVVAVGFVGRLQQWKGPDVFLRAGARVLSRPEAERVRLVVLGGPLFGRDRRYAAGLPALAAELGIADRVAFLGHRADALLLMAGIDVVAHCSVSPDPLPTVVAEAMALRRAVVATRSRGPEELVHDDHDGLLVPCGDVAGLADGVGRLVSSAELRRRLGEEAGRTARGRFGVGRMAEEFAAHWAGLTESLVETRS